MVEPCPACLFRFISKASDINAYLFTEGSTINRLDVSENASTKSDSADLAGRERNHQIMENVAKTMWNFLKDYKQKLKVLING